jgi:hypothetical protein
MAPIPHRTGRVRLRALAIDFEDLDVDDDLGARLVVLRDDLSMIVRRRSCRNRQRVRRLVGDHGS